MGFMIMQCGLGFSMRPFIYYFMGFIKPTYFYLQEGNRAFETAKPTPLKSNRCKLVIVLFILGAFLFAYRERN
jgi:hypothetical protein